ncbi:MAG TPA: HEAT repeat domain-containing protein [Gemmataceae bacterium]|jgi:HEAT repeat protein
MKKRLVMGLGVALMLLALAVWLEPTGVVLGWINGEAFYRNRPTRYWRKALTDSDPKTQKDTHEALKGGGRSALPVLAEVLQKDDRAAARWRAADLLGQIGPEARESSSALAALTAALRDKDPYVRAVAAGALASIGPAGPDALPPLRDMLSDGERVPALRALARYGAEAAPAIPQAIKLLDDDESEVRWNAARTLGKIGPAAREAVPALVAALKDDDALVREHAAEALGDIGPDAKDSVRALMAVLQDPDARVRRDAVRSLGQIGLGDKSAISAIEPLLKDKDEKVRRAARTTLLKETGKAE